MTFIIEIGSSLSKAGFNTTEHYEMQKPNYECPTIVLYSKESQTHIFGQDAMTENFSDAINIFNGRINNFQGMKSFI